MAGVGGEEAVKKLYSAAVEGDVNTIQQLLQQDPYLLHLASFPCSKNLLHVATMHGLLGIVQEILRRNPHLARDLDSQKRSPLHIAAAGGHVEIASELLSSARDMLWSRDGQGMNPVHVAAMHGHAKMLKKLVKSDPVPAKERVGRGHTALHLCVKHGHVVALKVLVDKMGELVLAKDDDGKTLLHLAIRCKRGHFGYLYMVAAEGHVNIFQQLLQQDPYLLHLVSFPCSRNLLHIATMHGQLGIVQYILERNEQLARDLDSQKRSPLHIAAARGHDDIASELLSSAPKMLWSRDSQGMNPIHVAAMNGRINMLKMLVMHDSAPAMERVDRGQTIMHLCVKYGHLEALKVLVDEVGNEVGGLVLAKDDDGETLLHFAVRYKRVEILKYLTESKKVKLESRNLKGETALGIMRESFPDKTSLDARDVRKTLRGKFFTAPDELLNKMSDMTMVVVILIATIAYQSTTNPLGGVWQDDSSLHRAGEAVMAYHHPKSYKIFVAANKIAFISSLTSILFLSVGLPSKHFIFLITAVEGVWVSLGSIAVIYVVSLKVITPHIKPQHQLDRFINWVVIEITFGIILCNLMVTLMFWLVKKLALHYDYVKRLL